MATLIPIDAVATYHLGDYACWDVYWSLTFSSTIPKMGQRIDGFTGSISDFWVYLTGGSSGTVTARIRKVSDDSIIDESSPVDIADLNDPPSSSGIPYKKFTLNSVPIVNTDIRVVLEWSGSALNSARSQGDETGGYRTHYSTYGGDHWVDSSGTDHDVVVNSYLGRSYDEDVGTYTECPKAKYPYTVHWDLGQVRTLNTIRIYWGADAVWRPHLYTLAVSLDGISWTTVATMDEGRPDSGWVSYTFGSESCRYVRFTTGASVASDLGTRIYEIEVVESIFVPKVQII